MNIKNIYQFWKTSRTWGIFTKELKTTINFYDDGRNKKSLFIVGFLLNAFIVWVTASWYLSFLLIPICLGFFYPKIHVLSWMYWVDILLCFSVKGGEREKLFQSFQREYYYMRHPTKIETNEEALHYLKTLKNSEVTILLQSNMPPLEILQLVLNDSSKNHYDEEINIIL